MSAKTNPEKEKITFKKIIYEFLIIFLAVTVSFFVDNLRSSFVERNTEKQYIKSLVEDIKLDTTELAAIIHRNDLLYSGADSLLKELSKPYSTVPVYLIYYYTLNYLTSSETFTHTDRTISQLKYAGGLRLIRNISISNSIIDYHEKVYDIEANGNYGLNIFFDLSKIQKQIIDFKSVVNGIYNLKTDKGLELLTSDPKFISMYYNEVFYYNNFLYGYRLKLLNLKKEGEILLTKIECEYNIK